MNNSDFEKIDEIIKNLNISYDAGRQSVLASLSGIWKDVIGEKISKFSKVNKISTDNIVEIVCSDSIVSNELYKEQERIKEALNDRLTGLGIEIKGIKFDYRKWKEDIYD